MVAWDVSEPFAAPFQLTTHNAGAAGLWIKPANVPRGHHTIGWSRLYLKGANWAGFQAQGCVHELWKHRVSEYVAFLKEHSINAVRLPLALPIVAAASWRVTELDCGERYAGWESLDVLGDVIDLLRRAGVFVALDMHTTSHPEGNQGVWYDDELGEQPIIDAWIKLATRFCAKPNVILADLFNEPHGASWSKWRDFVHRAGNAVLQVCPRWLIMAQGAGGGTREGFWWGENVLPQTSEPIRLSVPHRIVLSPHVYGHGNQWYMRASDFPENLPGVWDSHFGRVPSEPHGGPILIGEWGGVWTRTEFHGRVFAPTAEWQEAFAEYLGARGFGSFYWTLNDNSFRTGSLFRDAHRAEKLAMLARLPVPAASA